MNVPLAALTIALTLGATPSLPPRPDAPRTMDWPGVVTFAVGIGGITLGLGQSQDWGWTTPTFVALGVGAAALAAFVEVERRHQNPLIDLGLFRHLNFTAANLSQLIAGSIELATAFLLPVFLLLVVGVGPGAAGLALIPATLPIIVAAPLAGRWFDRAGGRTPLVVGFLVLAASSFVLAVSFAEQDVTALIPGFVLQGIGLGIILTVNDPTGLSAVPPRAQGQAAGVIDTSEQLGGAIGIAAFTVVLLHYYFDRLYEAAARAGIPVTPEGLQRGREFVLRAEQEGFRQVRPPRELFPLEEAFKDGHVAAYRFTFILMGALALLGAALMFALVRRSDRLAPAGVFSRRSRWTWALSGQGPGITRKPPGVASGGAGNDAGDGRPQPS